LPLKIFSVSVQRKEAITKPFVSRVTYNGKRDSQPSPARRHASPRC
jgi:hypothetical protein